MSELAAMAPDDLKTGERPRPVVLCVLDGWGTSTPAADNAITVAKAPNWRRFIDSCPNTLIKAAALDVGLPDGQMGNSEVGHMNLGAGRIVMQDMPRIDSAISDGSLARNERMQAFTAKLKETGGTCHLMGLISPGGVHSHQDEIAALARIVAEAGVPVAVHAFLDGRDTPPKSALGYLERFESAVSGCPNVAIVTVTGRYYAMDRDKRWDRVGKAYAMLTDAEGERAESAQAAVEAAYARGESDEFVKPTAVGDFAGMTDGDGVLMGNFRADRAREILTALLDPDFDGFERKRTVAFAAALGVTDYSTALNPYIETLFPPEDLHEILGEVLSERGFRQLRIAETEKYAHVTFFFNGGIEEPFPGEERILIPSPQVPTYDLKPEMSAFEVTDELVSAIRSDKFDFILVNYANGDMVGHTGDLEATVKAVEAVDTCLGRLAEAVEEAGGTLLITADHGNAEQMRDDSTGQAHTAHTTNLVPLVVINGPDWVGGVSGGRLADIAPTVLALMGVDKPADMTGHSLLEATSGGGRRADALATA